MKPNQQFRAMHFIERSLIDSMEKSIQLSKREISVTFGFVLCCLLHFILYEEYSRQIFHNVHV